MRRQYAWLMVTMILPNAQRVFAQDAVNRNNGQMIVAQATGGQLSTINYQLSTPLPVLQQGHSNRILSMVFAPGKSLLATASQDGTARLWDLKSGQLLLNLAQGTPVARLAFAAGGKTLVTQSSGQLRFWNVETGQAIGQTQVMPSSYATFAVSGDMVTTYTFQNQAQTWDARTGTLTDTHAWKPETQQKYGRPLAFLPDGKTLLFQREEQEEIDTDNNGANSPRRYKLVTFQLVDAETGLSRLTLQPFELRADQGYNADVVFAPDGSALALANNDSGARAWNLKTGKMLPLLKGNTSPVTSLAFSPDGKKLATGSNRSSKEAPSDVFVWDVATGKRLATLPGKPEISVRALRFDRTGQTLAVVAPNWHENQKGVQLWDVATGKPRVMTEGGGETDMLLFAPNDPLLVGGDGDGGLRVWNGQSGKQVAAFQASSALYYFSYSPDGALAAGVAFNGYLQIWDTLTGQLRDNFETNEQYGPRDRYLQTEPVFAPDGKTIAFVVPHSGSVDVYDLQTKQKRRLYSPNVNGTTNANRIIFSPDGKLMAVSGEKTSLVDVATGTIVGTLNCQFNNTGLERERIARFTPDNKTFLVLNNSAIQLYNVPGGQLRATVAPGRYQDGIHLSADGTTLAAMLDREVQFYDVTTGALKSNLKITDGEYLFGITLSPDAKYILTRGVQKMRIWNVQSGQIAGILTGVTPNSEATQDYNFNPSGLTFSNDSKWFAVRTTSNQVIIWDIAVGKRVAITSLEQLAILPPAFRRPLTASGESLVIHDPRTGTLLASLTAFAALTPDEQKPGAATPDDKVLAARPFAWIAQTTAGHYDGSANIASYLRWNVGGELKTGDNYAKEFQRPELVQKALRLQLPPPPTPTTQEKSASVLIRKRQINATTTL